MNSEELIRISNFLRQINIKKITVKQNKYITVEYSSKVNRRIKSVYYTFIKDMVDTVELKGMEAYKSKDIIIDGELIRDSDLSIFKFKDTNICIDYNNYTHLIVDKKDVDMNGLDENMVKELDELYEMLEPYTQHIYDCGVEYIIIDDNKIIKTVYKTNYKEIDESYIIEMIDKHNLIHVCVSEVDEKTMVTLSFSDKIDIFYILKKI